MITILGHHISHIRPEKILVPPRRNVFSLTKPRTRTRKLGIAEFLKLCLSYDSTWLQEPPKPWERS